MGFHLFSVFRTLVNEISWEDPVLDVLLEVAVPVSALPQLVVSVLVQSATVARFSEPMEKTTH